MVSPQPQPLSDLRVLIVDDDADARELFVLVLEHAGAEVRRAGDGDEAMVVMHSWRPDIVLSDLAMPTADGYALVRRMRLIEDYDDIPAVAISATTDARSRRAALAAGFSAIVPKPLDQDQLVAAASTWRPKPRAPA